MYIIIFSFQNFNYFEKNIQIKKLHILIIIILNVFKFLNECILLLNK